MNGITEQEQETTAPEGARTLRESEERFRRAFEDAPIGMALVGCDGRWLRVNQAICSLLGYDAEELLAIDFQTVTHPDDLEKDLNHTHQMLAGQIQSFQMEKRYFHKNGHIVWVALAVSAVRDENGQILYFVSQIRDISERKRSEEAIHRLNSELEERVVRRTHELAEANAQLRQEMAERIRMEEALRQGESFLRAITDHAPIFLAYCDTEHYYRFVNHSYAEQFGLTPEAIVGKRIVDVIGEMAYTQLLPYLEKVLEGTPVDFEVEVPYRGIGKHYRWISYAPDRAQDGTVRGMIAVVSDITRRRQAEEQARELAATLAQHAAELMAANKELEAFSYTISHDLRAPLRAIDGFSRILLQNVSATLPESQRRYLTRIRDGTRQMGRMIDGLLVFSRLSRQPLALQAVQIGDLARTVLASLPEDQEGRTIEIEIAPEMPQCAGDPALLHQVVFNLLSNALKYTRPRDRALIELGILPSDERDPVTFFVRDNGVGFEPKYADKLFGVFERLHRTEEFEGSGVGLAIVKRIVERHGGSVRAEGEPDRGATIFFTLPRWHQENTGKVPVSPWPLVSDNIVKENNG